MHEDTSKAARYFIVNSNQGPNGKISIESRKYTDLKMFDHSLSGQNHLVTEHVLHNFSHSVMFTHSNASKDTENDLKGENPLQNAINGSNIDDYIPSEVEARIRAMKYCNPPYLEADSEGIVHAKYQLEQVHVIIRHGDRSPMYHLPGNIDQLKLDCTMNNINHSDVLGQLAQEYRRTMHETKKHLSDNHPAIKGLGLYPSSKFCYGSQLTGPGALQHIANGIKFKKAYIDQHGLFAKGFEYSQIHVESTSYPRTYQSAVALLYGFLPEFNFSRISIHIKGTNPRLCEYWGNKPGRGCNCLALSKYKTLCEKQSGELRRNSKLEADLKAEVSQMAAISKKDLPWMASILDNLSGYVCHKLPLPCYKNNQCFTWPFIGRLWNYKDFYVTQQEMKNQMCQKYNRLYIHPLLVTIARKMGTVALNDQDSKPIQKTVFHLYSGHDMTVTPLMNTLGFSTGSHPPYAARIVIELYRMSGSDSNNKSRLKDIHFIKVLYNGKDVTSILPFCKHDLNEDGLCPLENFVDFVSHGNMESFHVKSYEEACALKGGL